MIEPNISNILQLLSRRASSTSASLSESIEKDSSKSLQNSTLPTTSSFNNESEHPTLDNRGQRITPSHQPQYFKPRPPLHKLFQESVSEMHSTVDNIHNYSRDKNQSIQQHIHQTPHHISPPPPNTYPIRPTHNQPHLPPTHIHSTDHIYDGTSPQHNPQTLPLKDPSTPLTSDPKPVPITPPPEAVLQLTITNTPANFQFQKEDITTLVNNFGKCRDVRFSDCGDTAIVIFERVECALQFKNSLNGTTLPKGRGVLYVSQPLGTDDCNMDMGTRTPLPTHPPPQSYTHQDRRHIPYPPHEPPTNGPGGTSAVNALKHLASLLGQHGNVKQSTTVPGYESNTSYPPRNPPAYIPTHPIRSADMGRQGGVGPNITNSYFPYSDYNGPDVPSGTMEAPPLDPSYNSEDSERKGRMGSDGFEAGGRKDAHRHGYTYPPPTSDMYVKNRHGSVESTSRRGYVYQEDVSHDGPRPVYDNEYTKGGVSTIDTRVGVPSGYDMDESNVGGGHGGVPNVGGSQRRVDGDVRIEKYLCRLELIDLFAHEPNFAVAKEILGANNMNIRYILEQSSKDVEICLQGHPSNESPIAERLHLVLSAKNASAYKMALESAEDLLVCVCSKFVEFCETHSLAVPMTCGFRRHQYEELSDGSHQYLGQETRPPVWLKNTRRQMTVTCDAKNMTKTKSCK